MIAEALLCIACHGATGWEGYGITNPARISVDFRIPNLWGSPGDSVAFWAGFGQGNPGIQQAGITGTVGSGWSAWHEMWPANARAFTPPRPPHAGDVMQFIVTHSPGAYDLTVVDETRHWTVSISQASADDEGGSGEAVAEGYGPPVPRFSAQFSYASAQLGRQFTFSGMSLRQESGTGFSVWR